MKIISLFLLKISGVALLLFCLVPEVHCEEQKFSKDVTYQELSQHGNLLQKPVAHVNGDPIMLDDLMSRMRKKAKMMLKRLDKTLSESIK